MQQYIVGAPFERFARYRVGSLPKSISGNSFLLVKVNYFSKGPQVTAIPNQETPNIHQAVIEQTRASLRTKPKS